MLPTRGGTTVLATGFEVVVVKGEQLIQWQYVRSELFGVWQSPSILARALRNPRPAPSAHCLSSVSQAAFRLREFVDQLIQSVTSTRSGAGLPRSIRWPSELLTTAVT